MSIASSANGPWSAPQTLFPLFGEVHGDTNPSPYINADGSAVGMWRIWGGSNVTHGGTIYLFTASNFDDAKTYKRSTEPLFPDLGPMGTEDSFLYRDTAGIYHAVFHHMYGLPFPTNTAQWWLCASGGHAYSVDGKKWVYTGVAWGNSTAPAGAMVAYEGGTTRHFSRQESPFLVILLPSSGSLCKSCTI